MKQNRMECHSILDFIPLHSLAFLLLFLNGLPLQSLRLYMHRELRRIKADTKQQCKCQIKGQG